MSTLKATYTSKNTKQVMETPIDGSKPLTDSICELQGQINAFLTAEMAAEKAAVTTVEQDAKEEEMKEMKAEEEEEEQQNVKGEQMTEVKEEQDSPMEVERPEVDDKQNVKKQKTDA